MSIFDGFRGADYWIKRGKEAANNYNFEAANACFKRVLQKEPENLSALFKSASCHIENNQLGQALELIDKCIKLDPANVLYKQKKGKVLEAQENYVDAIKWYETNIAEKPEILQVWWGHKALCLKKSGKQAEAVEWLNECLDEDPNFDFGYYLIANFLHDEEKYDEAVSFYERAVSLHGEAEGPSLLNMADCFVNLDKDNKAISCLDIVIDKNPEHPAAWREKAFMLEKLGHSEEAITCFDKLISLTPKSASSGPMGIGWYLCHKGDCLQKLGLLSQAHDCFIEASRIDFILVQAHIASKSEAELSEIGFAQTPITNLSENQFRYLTGR